jgi:hypothetical protein
MFFDLEASLLHQAGNQALKQASLKSNDPAA